MEAHYFLSGFRFFSAFHPVWKRGAFYALPILAAGIVSAATAQEPASHNRPEGQEKNAYHYMGTATCASSNCHGSAAPRNSSHILQNEYITWQKHDRHSLSYTVLEGDDSKRIARHLGIEAPEKEPLCLQCHATYAPSAQLYGEKFRIEDGVSCESCHGAAEGWLKEHTETGANYQDSVKRGMKDIVDPVVRTQLCASCHFGTDEKAVDHRLIGAGHPRLAFELDTFSQIQPRHWLVDDDYVKRKAAYNSARAWLIGQAILANEFLEKLLSQKRSHNGIMPELSLMYCYSCHHSLSDLQWKKREYSGAPGELRLNIAHLIVVAETLKSLDAALAERIGSDIKNLHHNYGRADVSAQAKQIQALLNTKVLPRFKNASLDQQDLDSLLKNLLEYATHVAHPQYEVAEQLAMGVSSIVAAVDPDGKLYQLQIDNLYKTLRTPENFLPEEFIAAAREFTDRIVR